MIKYKLKPLGLAAVTGLLLLACNDETKKAEGAEMAEAREPAIRLDYMDDQVKPGDDFFRYVNGKWADATEIPDDQTTWGSFNALRKTTDADAIEILERAMNDPKLDAKSDQAKAVYLYQSQLDTLARDKAGIAPVMPYLKQVDDIKDAASLQSYLEMAAKEQGGIPGFLSFYVYADAKNSNMNAAHLGSGSLGMRREYYVGEDDDSKEKLEKYRTHVARMHKFLGASDDEAAAVADRIVAFETKMAEPRLDKVARRDPAKTYNKMTIAELQKAMPAMNWSAFMDGIGAGAADEVIVTDKGYIMALSDILKEGDVQAWKDYLKWQIFNDAAGAMTTELRDANWEFYSKTMRGAKKQRDPKEQALGAVNGSVGEALGQLYVAEKFPPEAKAQAKEMIDYVIRAYEKRINNLNWMSPETKEKAIEKLQSTTVKIGYPDKWKDYSTLDIKSVDEGATYFDNMVALGKWNYEEMIGDLGEEVDKSEWGMAPQIVNAYFNPRFNEIVFPAAILQPPFYDYQADAAVNFGGMGAVIGHEISHSFDDSGADYDKNGNLNNWWTDEDLEKFNALGKDLSNMYSDIEVLPGININGDYTLGENIGDLGGVNAAYEAMKMYHADKGTPEPIDGFTPEQRFFLSWATVWRTKMRDEALKQRIKGDTHSPGMYRAYVPLTNMDEFYTAFDIKEGDKLYVAPEDRVRIW